jgi:hypothetical protein
MGGWRLAGIMAVIAALGCGGKKGDDAARRRDCQVILDTTPHLAGIKLEAPDFMAACAKASDKVVRCATALARQKPDTTACPDEDTIHAATDLDIEIAKGRPAP